jgi:hypothetical protein
MVLGMDIASTAPGDLRDCGNVVRFFRKVGLQGMEPHDELAYGATTFVLAEPGERYVVYSWVPDGQVGLRQMPAGRYSFEWFDCVEGSFVSQASVPVASGDRSWPRPAGIGDEVAVHIRRLQD